MRERLAAETAELVLELGDTPARGAQLGVGRISLGLIPEDGVHT
jgi:hypothetical protein